MQWQNRLTEAFKMGLDYGYHQAYKRKGDSIPDLNTNADFQTAFNSGYKQGYAKGLDDCRREDVKVSKQLVTTKMSQV